MITVTGVYQTAAGEARRARLEFKSTTTPLAAAGILYGNTRKIIFSDEEDGEWAVELYPGSYHVKVQDVDRITDFDIALPLNLDGTSVSIENVITTQEEISASEAIVTGEVAIDHESGSLPIVLVDISGQHFFGPPTAISARVIVPNSSADVFECVLIAGWTASQFSVRLLGLPETAGYKIAYTIFP